MGSYARGGGPVVEVIARLGPTVLDVRHLRPGSPPRSGRLGVVGLGLLAIGAAVSWWHALGLLVCLGGLALVMLGLVRSSDPDPATYSIGEGDAVSLCTPPADLVAPEGFELVRAGRGGSAWVRFTRQMLGEVTLGSCRGSLAQLVSAGRVVQDDGAFATSLPPGASCRIEHGDITFEISVVEATPIRVGRAPVDAPMWISSAGSLAVLGSLLVLAQLLAPTAEEMALADEVSESRFVRYFASPSANSERVERKTTVAPSQRPSAAAAVSTDPPRVARTQRKEPPILDRLAAPDRSAAAAVRETANGEARQAVRRPPTIHGRKGVAEAAGLFQRGDPLGLARAGGMLAMADTSSLGESEYADAFSPDADDREMWASISQGDVAEKGIAGGLGLVGKGRGGGEGSTHGIIRAGAEHEDALAISLGAVKVRGGLARESVRKVARRKTTELRRCYARGGARGKVTLRLDVDASGSVTATKVSHAGKGAFPKSCIASAGRRWQFPKAARGSTVTVVVSADSR